MSLVAGTLSGLLVKAQLKFKTFDRLLQETKQDLYLLQQEKKSGYTWSSVLHARISAAEAQYHASMLDGGYEELRSLGHQLKEARNVAYQKGIELEAVRDENKKLRVLGMLAATTSVSPNVSQELTSSIHLALVGKIDLHEFEKVLDTERSKLDEHSRKLLGAGPRADASARSYTF
jgi:hypothetical protein